MAKKEPPYNYAAEKKKLQSDLENGVFRHFYLIYGEEDYLRSQDEKWLRDTLLGSGDPSMNLSTFTGKDFTADDIIGIAQTMPFFADRRVVVLEETYLLQKAKSDVDRLVDYMRSDAYPETTCLLFVQKEIGNKNGKLYRTLSGKDGAILQCPVQSEDIIRKWIGNLINKRGLTIDNRAADLFLRDVGTDMLNVKNELEKLMSYCEGTGKITLQDVQAVTTPQVTDRIFDMIEAIARKQSDKALGIYADLLELNERPAGILWNLMREYNQLLCIKEMQSAGVGSQEMASRLKMNSWVVANKLAPIAMNTDQAQLLQNLERCAQTDMAYKSGKIDDRVGVEKLIVTCAAGKGV